MSLYAFGDIHGCLTALETLYAFLPLKEGDRLVFLGDYVDRGPASCGVIDFILTKQRERTGVITLRGNHEVMMLNARKSVKHIAYWQEYGGDETLDSYGITGGSNWTGQLPSSHWTFLENTQPYYETENEILVHAGLLPGVPLQAQKMDDLLWLHNTNPQPHCSGKRVIVGHTTQWNGEVRNCGHTVLIDTFAYGTGWLTALDVELNRCFQANERAQTRQLDL